MTDWKKKSAMAILAGGLFGANDAQAQPVNTNLVANPSFEIPGSGNVSSWSGGALATYAYSQGYTSINVPPASGLLYLHGLSGSATSNTTQVIDLVAAGFSPAFLDSGATFNLSGYFSSYFQSDFGTITAQFRDAANAVIGTSPAIGGQAFVNSLGTAPNINGLPGYTDWGLSSANGIVPVGTRSVFIDILHTRTTGTATDSYTDLVDFRISAIPEPGTLVLTSAAGATLVLRLRRRTSGDSKPS